MSVYDWKDALIKGTCLCAPDSEYACAACRERCLDSVMQALDELVPSAAPTTAPTTQPQPLPRATARYRR